jgi:hypothetical protein
MDENHANACSEEQEREVLNILMDSNLYLDLSLRERHILFKHVVEFYHAPAHVPETYS